VYTSTTQMNPPSWGLDRIDEVDGMDGTYNFDYTGAGVNAYIMDTPLTDQPEFGGRMLSCTSFTNESCAIPATNDHASHVAGKCDTDLINMIVLFHPCLSCVISHHSATYFTFFLLDLSDP
jgi:hypothetical protein